MHRAFGNDITAPSIPVFDLRERAQHDGRMARESRRALSLFLPNYLPVSPSPTKAV
jgi:hypothetical protein